MNKSNSVFFCRVCLSKNIENFEIVHYGFPAKNENWKCFFCFDCGSVSDFKIKKEDKVLIVEDVITTGKSSIECSKLVTLNNANIVGYACIIDRSNGKSEIKEKIME